MAALIRAAGAPTRTFGPPETVTSVSGWQTGQPAHFLSDGHAGRWRRGPFVMAWQQRRRPHTTVTRHQHGDGQVMIIFAMAALVLVGFVALSVDTGFLMAERRQAQSAADSAALAAATDALRNKGAGQVQASGKAYGATNADVPAGNVTINWPPASGTYAGNSKYVEAIVSKPVDKFFVGAVYSGAWEVTGRAVAGIEPEPRPYALLALKSPGIYINGSTKLYVDGGSAMSNSNINSSGGSNVFFADGSIDANGTITGNASWYAGDGMNPGSSVIPDPLATAQAPTTTGNPALPADCSIHLHVPAGELP